MNKKLHKFKPNILGYKIFFLVFLHWEFLASENAQAFNCLFLSLVCNAFGLLLLSNHTRIDFIYVFVLNFFFFHSFYFRTQSRTKSQKIFPPNTVRFELNVDFMEMVEAVITTAHS